MNWKSSVKNNYIPIFSEKSKIQDRPVCDAPDELMFSAMKTVCHEGGSQLGTHGLLQKKTSALSKTFRSI